eukprot:364741-Chlamydomonas_euryale.AAC.16
MLRGLWDVKPGMRLPHTCRCGGHVRVCPVRCVHQRAAVHGHVCSDDPASAAAASLPRSVLLLLVLRGRHPAARGAVVHAAGGRDVQPSAHGG